MKRIFGLVMILVALASGMNAAASPFGAGNIVIFRIGDGYEILSNSQNTVWLDEYTTNGTYVQSLMMPTNWFGANAPLISDGYDFAQGEMALSQDGRFLVVPGFGAYWNQNTNYSLPSEWATNEVPRVVGLVDGQGNINTTTILTDAFVNTAEIRSAASTDGTNIWLDTDSAGIIATTLGSAVATQVYATSSALRYINVYSNRLYFTKSTGIFDATNNPLPMVTNALFGYLPGTPTNGTEPFGFVMFNMTGGPTPDTLYTAEGTMSFSGENAGAVMKYCLVSGVWSNAGSLGAVDACGLTGVMNTFGNQTNITLFVTSGGTESPNTGGNYKAQANVFIGVDSSGFMGDPGTNATYGSTCGCSAGYGAGNDLNDGVIQIQPGGTGVVNSVDIRGVAMAPNGNQPLTNAANTKVSVGPPYPFSQVGSYGGPFAPATMTYSVANLSTNSMSYNWQATLATWLQASPNSGTINPGQSLTVVITNSAASSTKGAGTSTNTFAFNPGNVKIPAIIGVNAFALTPGTNFTATGPAGGPFVPSSQVYVLSNATAGTLQWTVNNVQTWGSLNSVTGGLAGFALTNITYSITNAAANSLTAGQYTDSIIFSNLSGHALLNTITPTLQVGFGIFDDYSTYTQNANLNGQNGWGVLDSGGQTPYQVANGALNLLSSTPPYTVCSAGEEDVKNMSTGAVTSADASYIYAGMLVTVSNAVATAGPPWSFNMEVGLIHNATYEHDASAPVDTNSGAGYLWGARTATDVTWAFGHTMRTYGVQYQVIVAGDLGGTNTWIFVNPPANSTNVNLSATAGLNLFTMNPDAACTNGDGEDNKYGVGGWELGQYGAAGACQAGIAVAKLAMSTNYAAVYQWLNPAPACSPPTASFTPASASGAAPLSVTFTDGSTTPVGTITTWNWVFGDTGSSTLQSPTHTYASPGTYTASLVVTNSCGDGSTNTTATATINVYDPFVWWEQFYGLTGALSGPNASYTGDGMSNTNKFMAGFNPTSAAAYLHVISVAKANGTNIVVTYLGANGDSTYTPGIASRTNVLEYTTGTANGSYSNNFQSTGQTNILGVGLSVNGGSGLGTVTNMTDFSGATNVPSRYYRVRVLLP